MFGALVESDDIEGALLIDTQQARRSAPHTAHPFLAFVRTRILCRALSL